MTAPAEITTIQTLLTKTRGLRQADANTARATGQKFNVFNVLGIGAREVTTHSPMLLELLNSNGRHGQGDAFLRLFLALPSVASYLQRQGLANFLEHPPFAAQREAYLGPVTEDSGGKVDLVLRNAKGQCLFIENKIHAAEQRNQLSRYHAHDPRAGLIYLTLQGTPPSTAPAGIEVLRLSYATDILRWLSDCEKAVASVARLLETLAQFRQLIEQLTHRSPMLSFRVNLSVKSSAMLKIMPLTVVYTISVLTLCAQQLPSDGTQNWKQLPVIWA